MTVNKKLTIKQEKFVNEYVDTGNGRQSVIEAGYNVANGNVAGAIACENLTKPNVALAIVTKKAQIAELLEQESMSLLTELLSISKNSPSDAVRLKACQDLLDRAGYNAKKDLTISGGDTAITIETRHTSELAKRAREMMVQTAIDI